MNCPHCDTHIDECICVFEPFAGNYYDKTRIVGLEKGEWIDGAQDWKGILVFDSGLRISVNIYLDDLIRRMRKDKANING